MDYAALVETARLDDRIVGLVLTGSRGRGLFVRPESDWDVRLVVRDDAIDECDQQFSSPHGSLVDVAVYSVADFQLAGEIGTTNEWDRYSYAHAEVVIDKLNGDIRGLVAEKSVLPSGAAREIAARALDGYINSYYRSAKNFRDDLPVAAQLDAAESVPQFVTALFALHERVRPFNKFLAWELETHPLGEETWSAAALLPRLQMITAEGDLGEQQRLFRDTERLARERQLGEVIDAWEPDVGWLRGAGAATAASHS
jgi:hypothetical protein